MTNYDLPFPQFLKELGKETLLWLLYGGITLTIIFSTLWLTTKIGLTT